MGNQQSSFQQEGAPQFQQIRTESHYSRWESPNLHQVGGIQPNQLPQLHQQFLRAAGPDGLISHGEFARLYRELNIGPTDQGSIDRAFRAFDRDGSGQISFDEFMSATVALNNNSHPRERIRYLIDSNNPYGANHTQITPEYARNIIRNINRFYGANANFDDIWSQLNVNNGVVSRDEFVTHISQSPTFVRYF